MSLVSSSPGGARAFFRDCYWMVLQQESKQITATELMYRTNQQRAVVFGKFLEFMLFCLLQEQFDKSWEYLEKANRLQKGREGREHEQDQQLLDVLTSMFRPPKAGRAAGMYESLLAGLAGFPDETPVFVVGMPRSGSTLVEQILASHPQAFGAGALAAVQACCLCMDIFQRQAAFLTSLRSVSRVAAVFLLETGQSTGGRFNATVKRASREGVVRSNERVSRESREIICRRGHCTGRPAAVTVQSPGRHGRPRLVAGGGAHRGDICQRDGAAAAFRPAAPAHRGQNAAQRLERRPHFLHPSQGQDPWHFCGRCLPALPSP